MKAYSVLLAAVITVLLCVPVSLSAAEVDSPPSLMWINAKADERDYYVAFRGQYTLEQDAEIEIRTLGSSWYVLWSDGSYLNEGPARFEIQHPEYGVVKIRQKAGRHVLAVQVHHAGVETRMLVDMPPFLYASVRVQGREIAVQWRTARLGGYRSQVRRINPQLTWIEWCDTRTIPAGWQQPDYDDHAWTGPVPAKTQIGTMREVRLAPVKQFPHTLKPLAEGTLVETFGYEADDPPARFFLRDLSKGKLPPQGSWRRYDLGRVRLGRPRFVLDVPVGAVVEFACAETLTSGRVAPYINLSTGTSCNMDHYVARGGLQEFFPLTPKGGRYLEVHVLADPASIKWTKEEFLERCYYDTPVGAFSCGDPVLEKIWKVGIETHRACAEDALVDNPTRERGQWTGDTVSVGMDLAAVGYSDLRLCRRALEQSAQCARKDGMIAGLCPGGVIHLATFAAQWLTACVHYYELTGDRSVLEEFYPYAVNNMKAFEPYITADGLIDGAGWPFVDWGYARNPGPADIAYNLHFLLGLRSMIEWCDILGKSREGARYVEFAKPVQNAVARWIDSNAPAGRAGWEKIGYHSSVLALSLGFVDTKCEKECIAYIKDHILNCFPNKPDAPRLSDPDVKSHQLITPYFSHYAFPPLIERGEMDFVLDQYRTCWGWMLEDDRTTWIEVFDPRWSHSHQWSGCPTWQLTRYVLGLHPCMDNGKNHFTFKLISGSLKQAQGTLPFPDGMGLLHVQWIRQADGIHYKIVTDEPIHLHMPPASPGGKPEIVDVENEYERLIP